MKSAIFRFCTLTGADDSTNIAELLALSEILPFVEWGVLVSPSHTGTGRYPSRGWIEKLVAATQGMKKRPNLAMNSFTAGPGRSSSQPQTAASWPR